MSQLLPITGGALEQPRHYSSQVDKARLVSFISLFFFYFFFFSRLPSRAEGAFILRALVQIRWSHGGHQRKKKGKFSLSLSFFFVRFFPQIPFILSLRAISPSLVVSWVIHPVSSQSAESGTKCIVVVVVAVVGRRRWIILMRYILYGLEYME